jgi:hypothetical protein
VNHDQAAQAHLRALRQQWLRGRLDPVAVDVLDRTSPGWRLSNRDRAWFERLTVVAEWVVAHDGRHPSTKGADAEEKSLGGWLSTQRQRELDTDKLSAVDAAIPGWKQTRHSDEHWAARLTAVRAWREHHGRWPTESSGDAKERSYASWLYQQRAATLAPARKALIDAGLPGWDVTRFTDAHWWARLDAVCAAVDAAGGRRPSTRATALSERGDAAWLSNSRRNVELTTAQMEALELRLPRRARAV